MIKYLILLTLLIWQCAVSQNDVTVMVHKPAATGSNPTQVAIIDSVISEVAPSEIDQTWSQNITISSGKVNGCLGILIVLSGAQRHDHLTVGGSAVTQLPDSVDQRLYAYRFLAPTSGVKAVAGHASNNDKFTLYAFHMEGVNQTTPAGTGATGSQGYGGNLTATITLATGDLGISVYHGWTSDGTPTAPMSLLVRYGHTNASGAFGSRTGNGSSACEWTFSDQAGNTLAIPFKIN